jgi:hypothetical protein
MVIQYCKKCGALVRGESGSAIEPVCEDCMAGKPHRTRTLRDSDMIPNRLRRAVLKAWE